jgi:hypothetical protein
MQEYYAGTDFAGLLQQGFKVMAFDDDPPGGYQDSGNNIFLFKETLGLEMSLDNYIKLSEIDKPLGTEQLTERKSTTVDGI